MKNIKLIPVFTLLVTVSIIGFSANSTLDDCFSVGDPFFRLENKAYQFAGKTYSHESGTKITLLAAIHVAPSEFYDAHERVLSNANQVLFEGKGFDEEGLKVHESELGKLNELLTNAHLQVAEAFGLRYQFDYINYNRVSFTHADLTLLEVVQMENFADISSMLAQIQKNIDECKQKFADKSENPIQYFFNQCVTQYTELGWAKYFEEKMKPLLLMNEDQLREAIGNEQLYDNEYTKRNLIFLEKLKTALNVNLNDSDPIHIVVYYGVAHLPFIEREIYHKHGFTPESQEWYTYAEF